MIFAAVVVFMMVCWWLDFRRSAARTDFSWPLFGMALGAIGLMTVVIVGAAQSGWGQRHPFVFALLALALMIGGIVWVAMRGLKMKQKKGI